MSKVAPEADSQSLKPAPRQRVVRSFLSPEVSELLKMLEAFENRLASDAIPAGR